MTSMRSKSMTRWDFSVMQLLGDYLHSQLLSISLVCILLSMSRQPDEDWIVSRKECASSLFHWRAVLTPNIMNVQQLCSPIYKTFDHKVNTKVRNKDCITLAVSENYSWTFTNAYVQAIDIRREQPSWMLLWIKKLYKMSLDWLQQITLLICQCCIHINAKILSKYKEYSHSLRANPA